jgi:hypothetical protein
MKDHIVQIFLGFGMLIGMAASWRFAELGKEMPQLLVWLTGGCAMGLGIAYVPGGAKIVGLLDVFSQMARQLPRESSLTMEVKKEEGNDSGKEIHSNP